MTRSADGTLTINVLGVEIKQLGTGTVIFTAVDGSVVRADSNEPLAKLIERFVQAGA